MLPINVSSQAGFAFPLPDFTPEETLKISFFPPYSCVPMTAFVLTRSLPNQIFDWLKRANQLGMETKNPLQPRHVFSLWRDVALAQNTPIDEELAETIIRLESALRASERSTSPRIQRDALFQKIPDREKAETIRSVVSSIVNSRFGSFLANVRQEVALENPQWSPERCHEEAVNYLFEGVACPLLSARAFNLKASQWRPSDTFAKFQECLRIDGPMIVYGPFGPLCNPSPPVPHKVSVLGLPTFGWSESTNETAVISTDEIGLTSMMHAVLVVAAAQVEGFQLIYFQDTADLSRIFTISYQKLAKTAAGCPSMRVNCELPEECLKQIQETQTFGHHAPDWTTPPTEL